MTFDFWLNIYFLYSELFWISSATLVPCLDLNLISLLLLMMNGCWRADSTSKWPQTAAVLDISGLWLLLCRHSPQQCKKKEGISQGQSVNIKDDCDRTWSLLQLYTRTYGNKDMFSPVFVVGRITPKKLSGNFAESQRSETWPRKKNYILVQIWIQGQIQEFQKIISLKVKHQYVWKKCIFIP